MSQLRQHAQWIRKLRIDVIVITFDADEMASAYSKSNDLPWPMLSDPSQSLYKAYGLIKGSWWSIYGISSIWKYLKLIFRGRLPGKPGRDWRQLGGDILIDPEGVVRIHYISDGPHDRPSVEYLLAPVESEMRVAGN